jgi:hypothetical protein
MKKNMLRMIVVLGLIFSFSGIVLAVDPPTMANTIVKKDYTILKTADLRVNFIEAWPCACEADAGAANAIILKGPVIVRVQNAGPFATDAYIKVRIWNYFTSSEQQHAKLIHLNSNEFKNEVITSINATATAPWLFKKSYGIKAEITVNSPNTTDPNASNNSKTINVCQYTID